MANDAVSHYGTMKFPLTLIYFSKKWMNVMTNMEKNHSTDALEQWQKMGTW